MRNAAPGRRRTVGVVLVLGVLLLHGVLGWSLAETVIGWGDARPMQPRLQAAFVRELLPSAPPAATTTLAAAPLPVQPPRGRAAVAPARAASRPAQRASEDRVEPEAERHPSDAASAPAVHDADGVLAPADVAASDSAVNASGTSTADAAAAPDSSASASAPAEDVRAAAAASAAPSPEASDSAAASTANSTPASTAAASPADAAASSPAFDWPLSTRLSYVLVGNYRGAVKGSAQVEWIRAGDRYQVHLDVIAGLSFAPLFSRRMTSDGAITAVGLAPHRYDEVTKRAFSDARRVDLRFEGAQILYVGGQRLPQPAGVQDSASQFVQMIWRFRTQPQLLQVGAVIDMPLALPRGTDLWRYKVVATETLHTNFGALDTFHLTPQRVPRPGGDLSVEIWFAPSLQYLPARILIRQDERTYIDLLIERPPQQAAN